MSLATCGGHDFSSVIIQFTDRQSWHFLPVLFARGLSFFLVLSVPVSPTTFIPALKMQPALLCYSIAIAVKKAPKTLKNHPQPKQSRGEKPEERLCKLLPSIRQQGRDFRMTCFEPQSFMDC